MQPTIKDVAAKAGVSVASVSRMINDSNNIAPETAELIQEAIDELGYKPIRKKKNKKIKDRQIGLVMPDTGLYTLGSTIKDITAILLEEDYDLRIINLNHKREITTAHVEMLLNKKLSGVIFYGCHINKHIAEVLNDADMPSVVFQGSSPYLVSVSVNNYNGMTNAVQYVISRGYKKIAFVGWREADFNMKARLDAFKKTMEEHKLDASSIFLNELNRGGGKLATAEAWEKVRPEAIVYAADILAFGGYRYLHENNIKIPEDVGIMGFDDAYLSEVIGLTTMYQLLDAKLRIVMVHLLRMIHEKKNAEPEEVLITPRLVVRTSLK